MMLYDTLILKGNLTPHMQNGVAFIKNSPLGLKNRKPVSCKPIKKRRVVKHRRSD